MHNREAVPMQDTLFARHDYLRKFVEEFWKKLVGKPLNMLLLDAGVKAYIGEVSAGQVLVIPPGFVCATATDEKTVSGVRKSFLTADKVTKENFEVLVNSGLTTLTAIKDLVASKVSD